jgi:hypothetical protein
LAFAPGGVFDNSQEEVNDLGTNAPTEANRDQKTKRTQFEVEASTEANRGLETKRTRFEVKAPTEANRDQKTKRTQSQPRVSSRNEPNLAA